MCLNVIRESIRDDTRVAALDTLLRTGDQQVLTELEQMVNGPHLERIEKNLGITINELRKRLNEAR
ncbi:hypothetical protein HQ563_01095 [bacterium]|nr:hypothetical protein [bacterium]